MCVLLRSSSENFSRNKYLQIRQNKNMKHLLVSSLPCLSCNKCVQESAHRAIAFPFLPCTNEKTDSYLSLRWAETRGGVGWALMLESALSIFHVQLLTQQNLSQKNTPERLMTFTQETALLN